LQCTWGKDWEKSRTWSGQRRWQRQSRTAKDLESTGLTFRPNNSCKVVTGCGNGRKEYSGRGSASPAVLLKLSVFFNSVPCVKVLSRYSQSEIQLCHMKRVSHQKHLPPRFWRRAWILGAVGDACCFHRCERVCERLELGSTGALCRLHPRAHTCTCLAKSAKRQVGNWLESFSHSHTGHFAISHRRVYPCWYTQKSHRSDFCVPQFHAIFWGNLNF